MRHNTHGVDFSSSKHFHEWAIMLIIIWIVVQYLMPVV